MTRLHTWVAYVLLAAVLPLILGCVPVKNIVERWNACEADGALVGTWLGEDDDLVIVLRMHNDGYLTMHDIEADDDEPPELAIRTFEQNGTGFLLMAQYEAVSAGFDETIVDDAGRGIVMSYRLEEDEMVWSILKQQVLAAAIEAGDVAGEMLDGEPVLDALDDATLAWLGEVFADADNVDEDRLVFTRAADED